MSTREIINLFNTLLLLILGTMTPTNTGSCTWDVTPITSCSTLSGDATKHSYSYQECSTGTVTSISSNQASGTEKIVLIGQGFSTTSCRNEIKLGDYRCVVSSATSTKATCTVDAQQAMQVRITSFLAEFIYYYHIFCSQKIFCSIIFVIIDQVACSKK